MVRHVAADLRRRNDDPIARRARRHERVEIGHRAGLHANLGEARAEYFRGQLGRDDLDLLDRLQPHLVLVAGIAERNPRAEAAGEQRLGLRVHDVGGGIQVDAERFVNLAILAHQTR